MSSRIPHEDFVKSTLEDATKGVADALPVRVRTLGGLCAVKPIEAPLHSVDYGSGETISEARARDTFVDGTSHVLSLLWYRDKFQEFETRERLQFLASESRPERKMKINRSVAYYVLALTCCLMQQGLMVAVAQEQQPIVAAEQTGPAATMKSGVAGGAGTINSSPALTGVRRPLYRLCKSDVVAISFVFSPEFDQIVNVQPDGYIALKGLKPLTAEGTTVPELQAAIERAYAGVLHDPDVTIVLQDFDKPYFIVGGEVNHPAKYELRSDISVTEAVAIAGGLTQRAKHSQVVLFRRVSDDLVESHLLDVKAMMKSRTLAEDMPLKPGDFLFVPQNLISKIKQYLPTSSLSMYASPTQF